MVGYYPATQRNKRLMGTIPWMHLRNTMLSGSSQTEKATHLCDSTYMIFMERQNYRMKSTSAVARGWGLREGTDDKGQHR